MEAIGFLEFTCQVAEAALRAGIWFIIENPRRSLLWCGSAVQQLLRREEVTSAVMVYCRFGAPRLKRTRFAGNLPGGLSTLSSKHAGGHTHTRIQGHTRVAGRSVAFGALCLPG